jgi:hypothetical protein
MRRLADADPDLAVENDHLLVLVGVDVQRERGAARLFGLPHTETAATVGGGDSNDDSYWTEPQR